MRLSITICPEFAPILGFLFLLLFVCICICLYPGITNMQKQYPLSSTPTIFCSVTVEWKWNDGGIWSSDNFYHCLCKCNQAMGCECAKICCASTCRVNFEPGTVGTEQWGGSKVVVIGCSRDFQMTLFV